MVNTVFDMCSALGAMDLPEDSWLVGMDNNNYDAIEWTDDPSFVKPTKQEVEAVIETLREKAKMLSLREKRNKLLVDTDWQAMPDRTMTQEQKDYRQALRDLPSTATPVLTKDGQLTEVTWPTEPE